MLHFLTDGLIVMAIIRVIVIKNKDHYLLIEIISMTILLIKEDYDTNVIIVLKRLKMKKDLVYNVSKDNFQKGFATLAYLI